MNKFLHAAKCLNSDCDNPVNIPWKENCELVKKSENETKPETNGISNGETNGHDELEISENVDGVRCEECGTKFTDGHIEKFVKAMEFTELHLQDMKGASVACILFKTKKYAFK